MLKIQKDLRKLATLERKKTNEYFFKTGVGQYGHGDIFLGVRVPDSRLLALKNIDTEFSDLEVLLESPFHEDRLLALHILVYKYEKVKDEKVKDRLALFYLKNLKGVNNWDLVDASAHYIFGEYLFRNKEKESLREKLIKSKNLWERRVAIVSTWHTIRKGETSDILRLSSLVLSDKEDLMHKATGWMLREMGKNCNPDILRKFLKENIKNLPRTTLRYAIEKFDKEERGYWLKL